MTTSNAIELLQDDHREVESLFKQFEEADSDDDKVALASSICHALGVHAEIEERIFYPESRRVLDEKSEGMVDEAVVEHASLKALMADLEDMVADDELFEARVKVLKEYVQHHVKEEEEEFFPKVRETSLDLEALGRRLQELKDSLIDADPPGVIGGMVSFPTFTAGAVLLRSPTDTPRPRAM